MAGRTGPARAVLLLIAAASASAQAAAPPDPAGVTLPDLTPPADSATDADPKYYYFRKPGVSYAEAYEDFSECYRYLPVDGTLATLPMFAPWSEAPGVERFQPVNNYGLVGMGVAAASFAAGEKEWLDERGRRGPSCC